MIQTNILRKIEGEAVIWNIGWRIYTGYVYRKYK